MEDLLKTRKCPFCPVANHLFSESTDARDYRLATYTLQCSNCNFLIVFDSADQVIQHEFDFIKDGEEYFFWSSSHLTGASISKVIKNVEIGEWGPIYEDVVIVYDYLPFKNDRDYLYGLANRLLELGSFV